MTPVPVTRHRDRVQAKLEETVAHCEEATRENERVVDTIEELLRADDTGRVDRQRTPSR